MGAKYDPLPPHLTHPSDFAMFTLTRPSEYTSETARGSRQWFVIEGP